jgi:hypothetical protein
LTRLDVEIENSFELTKTKMGTSPGFVLKSGFGIPGKNSYWSPNIGIDLHLTDAMSVHQNVQIKPKAINARGKKIFSEGMMRKFLRKQREA